MHLVHRHRSSAFGRIFHASITSASLASIAAVVVSFKKGKGRLSSCRCVRGIHACDFRAEQIPLFGRLVFREWMRRDFSIRLGRRGKEWGHTLGVYGMAVVDNRLHIRNTTVVHLHAVCSALFSA